MKVIDLNFRNCNSTRGLMFREELRQKWNWDCITIRGLICQGDAEAFLKTMAAATGEKRVFPWAIQVSGDQLRTTMMCGGNSRKGAGEQFDLLARELAG